MLKNYCIKSVSSKTCYFHVAQFFFISCSILFHLWSTPIRAELPQSVDFIKVGFVEFDIGEYRQERFGQVGQVFNQLKAFPETISIRLVGHSHSNANLASNKLAAIRASSVRDKLINFGLAPRSISIDYDVQNYVASGKLLHGVSVLVPHETQPYRGLVTHREVLTSEVKSTERSFNPSVQAIAIIPSTVEIEPDKDLCNLVSIYSGSLRDNLEREIGDCGYIMGRWRFGTGDEVIDWDVPVAFSTIEDNGIIGLLELIERNYQIRAQIHELDDSIDFFPSIRDRGNRSQ